MSGLDLDALAALEADATAAPWVRPIADNIETESGLHVADTMYVADAALIVALRNAAPALIAAARNARPCDGGCSYNDGPQEECSLHGRSPADLWQMLATACAERDAAQAALAECHSHGAQGSAWPCATIRALLGEEPGS